MTKIPRKTRLEKVLDTQRETLADVITMAGSQQALGKALGVSQAAISKWLVKGYVPLKRACEIEQMFGVPRATIANPKVVEMLQSTDSMLTAG